MRRIAKAEASILLPEFRRRSARTTANRSGACFIQDDFKTPQESDRDLGLRWSYFGPLSSKQGNMFRATPGPGANYLSFLTVAPGHSWDFAEG